jgi:GGDEF domain-containing protein
VTERARADDPDIQDRQAERELIDPATALPGERLAFEHLDRSIALARRQHWGAGVLSIGPSRSMDKFAGELVDRLNGVVRASDFLARPGRAEFVVVLTAMATPNEIDVVAARLLLVLARPLAIGPLTWSVGGAAYPKDGDTARRLLTTARQRHQAAAGKNGGYHGV